MPRLFVGIPIPGLRPLVDLQALLRAMGGAIRPVRLDNLHITLRFFGDVDESLIEPLSRAVETAAAREAAFDLELDRLGVFPNRVRVRVVWVGFKDAQALVRLADAVDVAIAASDELAALPARDAPLTPHLTVARVQRKPPRELGQLLDQPPLDARIRVDALHLIESDLTSIGPGYSTKVAARLRP